MVWMERGRSLEHLSHKIQYNLYGKDIAVKFTINMANLLTERKLLISSKITSQQKNFLLPKKVTA
jgi:hypothetical protein